MSYLSVNLFKLKILIAKFQGKKMWTLVFIANENIVKFTKRRLDRTLYDVWN
jgi:hypothetical protein